MIIDHETMTEMGPTDETLELRVVTPVAPAPEVQVDYPAMEEKVLSVSEWGARKQERWLEQHRSWSSRWAGPFPVRPVQSMTGRLSIKKPDLVDVPRDAEGRTRMTLEKLAREASVSEIVEAVALLDDAEGVEQESSDDTSTFALPAVWKLTGRVSDKPAGHRTAHRIQQTFRAAGWDISVWYGEHTHKFWVMDEIGIHEFETITAMYRGMGWEVL